MSVPTRLITNNAFVKKFLTYIKFYPVHYKDPKEFLETALEELESLVMKANNLCDLEPICNEAKMMIKHTNPENLCQLEVQGERGLYLIYDPLKFTDSNRADGKIALLYDLIHLTSASYPKPL